MADKLAVVLLSGGLDSATTLYFAESRGFECLCLIFDYGQRHRREIEAAKRIAQSAKCKYQIIKINLPWKGSSLLDKKIKISGATKSPACPAGRPAGQAGLPAGQAGDFVAPDILIFLSKRLEPFQGKLILII